MMREYNNEIAMAIDTYLREDDWAYQFNQETGTFSFDLPTGSKIRSVKYIIRVMDDAFAVYAYSPLNADSDSPEALAEMSAFLHNANYGLRVGNFELDAQDGEIRYKIYVGCTDALPSKQTIKRNIIIPVIMYRKYAEGLVGLILDIMTAKEAIQKCESKEDEE